MDISAAFLIRNWIRNIIVIRPPGMMVKMGLIGPNDRWVIMKAGGSLESLRYLPLHLVVGPR
eukprot:1148983-Amphidinium_carterae.2